MFTLKNLENEKLLALIDLGDVVCCTCDGHRITLAFRHNHITQSFSFDSAKLAQSVMRDIDQALHKRASEFTEVRP